MMSASQRCAYTVAPVTGNTTTGITATGSFSKLAVYEGSGPYEHGREATMQHLLYAVAEMMKQLFWSGDLQSSNFPPEIEVFPILVYNEKRTGRRKFR